MTHTSKVADMRRKLDRAREDCPHWDYESESVGHDCCEAVARAKEAYRIAVRRARRQDAGSW